MNGEIPMLFNIDLKAILIAFAGSYGAIAFILQKITFALLATLLPDTPSTDSRRFF